MAELKDYVEVVRKERPLLGKAVDDFGELSVLDCSVKLFERGKLHKEIYKPKFTELLKKTFPLTKDEIIRQYDDCLRNNPIVSTADHHCIINHPVYLNSNILLSLFSNIFSNEKAPYLVPPVLSFSAIPLNNAAYPRGILLGTPEGEKRFSFFGSKLRHESVLLTDKVSFSGDQINQWVADNTSIFTKEELSFIKGILLEIGSDSEIQACSNYAEQTNVFNKWLWKKIYPGCELSFFPIEKLTRAFFLEILSKERSSALYKFLFEYPLDKQDTLFDGIYGAWSLSKLCNWLPGGGTAFFWGVGKGNKLIPLKRVASKLISGETDFKPIFWSCDSLVQALQNGRLVPSILLNYLVIAGYYGLFCSGAFNQIGYLGPILKQYQKGLLECSENKEAERVGNMQADGIHAFLYFLFGKGGNGIVPSCTFNILQTGNSLENTVRALKKITVKTVFDITAPLNFPFITDPKTRDSMGFSFKNVYKELEKIVPDELIIQRW